MRPRTTVAVLGATGPVGSRVTTEAAARGHQVPATSRKPAREPAHTSAYGTPLAVDVSRSLSRARAPPDDRHSVPAPARPGGSPAARPTGPPATPGPC